MGTHMTGAVAGWIALATLLAGCTQVQIYEKTKDGPVRCSGVTFYPPKPYLFVKSCPEQKCRDAEVVVLPDLDRPRRVSQTLGAGTASWTLTLNRGMLSKWDSTYDSGGQDTVGALATAYTNVMQKWLDLEKQRAVQPPARAPTPLEELRSLFGTEAAPPCTCCQVEIYEILIQPDGTVELKAVEETDRLAVLERAIAKAARERTFVAAPFPPGSCAATAPSPCTKPVRK